MLFFLLGHVVAARSGGSLHLVLQSSFRCEVPFPPRLAPQPQIDSLCPSDG